MEREYDGEPPSTPAPQTGGRAEALVCDWGSTRLRAWLVDSDGRVSQRHESDRGIKTITGGASEYRATLDMVLAEMNIGPGTPIHISGMAGSKKGWIETSYLPTPAGRPDFASNFVSLPGWEDARLYGGLKHLAEDGSVDVMRGEEVQVFGILDLHPEAERICLPGTHSKWVRVKDGRITGFKSYMTGDLFHSLCEHSIFREQIGSREFNREGFLHGCRLAAEGNGLDDLFRLRTEFVFSAVSEERFHSCLSGFLIANEIKAAKGEGTVVLCGSTLLMESYALALEQASIHSIAISSETATLQGHQPIMRP